MSETRAELDPRRDGDWIARLTVYGLPLAANRVANWLRDIADDIARDPDRYSGVFDAKLVPSGATRPPQPPLSKAAKDRKESKKP